MTKPSQWRPQKGKAPVRSSPPGKPEGLPGPTADDSRPSQAERSAHLKAETTSRVTKAFETMAGQRPEPFPSSRRTATEAGCSPNIFHRNYRDTVYHDMLVAAQGGFVERNPNRKIPAHWFIDHVEEKSTDGKGGERRCFRCRCEENRRLKEENEELRFRLAALSADARPPRPKHRP